MDENDNVDYALPASEINCKSKSAYLSWILSNLFIRRDKDHAFDMGLGDQHAIEWIFVNWRQIQSRQSVLARDSEFMPAIVDKGAPESLRLDAEIFAT